MKKCKWLDRGLITGPYLALCLTQGEFDKACAHLKMPSEGQYVKPGKGATLWTFTGPGGSLACVLCLKLAPGLTPIQIAALLVHEAVHVFQQQCDAMGEHSPSSEFAAYSIQAIAQTLFEEFAARRP